MCLKKSLALLPILILCATVSAEEEIPLGEEMLASGTRISKRLESQKWAVELDSQTRLRKIADGRIMRLEILRTGRVAWHPQLIAGNLTFEKGKCYTFSIRIRADRPVRLSLGIRQARDPWNNLGFHTRIDVGTQWKTFQFTFRPSETENDARLDLNAFRTGVYEISDSSLRPGEPRPQVPVRENEVLE